MHALVLPLGRRKVKKSEKILAWFLDGVSVERSFSDDDNVYSLELFDALRDIRYFASLSLLEFLFFVICIFSFGFLISSVVVMGLQFASDPC